jgi:hypothetical protein
MISGIDVAPRLDTKITLIRNLCERPVYQMPGKTR